MAFKALKMGAGSVSAYSQSGLIDVYPQGLVEKEICLNSWREREMIALHHFTGLVFQVAYLLSDKQEAFAVFLLVQFVALENNQWKD
ncbi:hypothetical protein ATANTOWER_031458 [Ataeniobius toweri]|uniref:Uncharacterized protein n=1 Tax=Ataeniobius toweri TaxID=208326 RepID=A0ABU7AV96_9TELE|nr:hypothetical protein [Ataeniobius toweri]